MVPGYVPREMVERGEGERAAEAICHKKMNLNYSYKFLPSKVKSQVREKRGKSRENRRKALVKPVHQIY